MRVRGVIPGLRGADLEGRPAAEGLGLEGVARMEGTIRGGMDDQMGLGMVVPAVQMTDGDKDGVRVLQGGAGPMMDGVFLQ